MSRPCPFHKRKNEHIETVEDPDGNPLQRCMVCGAFGPDFENEVGACWETRAEDEEQGARDPSDDWEETLRERERQEYEQGKDDVEEWRLHQLAQQEGDDDGQPD